MKIITPGGERWEFPVAQTPKGMYWGYIEETRGGKRILSFRGIPYAQPPVGPLRWKPPRTNIPEWKVSTTIIKLPVVTSNGINHVLNSCYLIIEIEILGSSRGKT